MGKSLSAVLLFVIYCLLNIYEGILMSASPMRAIANTCANVLPCLFNFNVLQHIKLFLSINTDVCQEKRP